MDDFIKILKTISDKTRLRVINMLLKRAVCVCELKEVLKISQPAVSKHIKKLKDIGIVNENQKGYWSYYSINLSNKKAKKVLDFLITEIKKEEVIKKDIKILKKVLCKKNC